MKLFNKEQLPLQSSVFGIVVHSEAIGQEIFIEGQHVPGTFFFQLEIFDI